MEPPDPALWLCSLSPALICVPLNITWMCRPCKAIIGAGIVKLCSPRGSVDAESRGDNVHGCILPAVNQQGRHALSKVNIAQSSSWNPFKKWSTIITRQQVTGALFGAKMSHTVTNESSLLFFSGFLCYARDLPLSTLGGNNTSPDQLLSSVRTHLAPLFGGKQI